MELKRSDVLSPALDSNLSGGGSSRQSAAAAASSGRSSLSPAAGYPLASPLSAQQQQQKRRNAWGSQSYADLITQAIESSPQSRLTLSEIYDWMIKNIGYFSSKGDTNSSAGWKNSVRHNLSLHSKFVRVQNEQTGKSSYWTIDYSVKDRASYRRRATTADAARCSELQRKRQAALARRRQTSGSSTSSTLGSAAHALAPSETTQLPRAELQVSSVLNQLVSPERLLDPNQPIETLLMESLSDAVLESFADGSAAAAAAAVAESSEPLRSLTDQLHLMTCRHHAGGAGDPACCWATANASASDSTSVSELCLPLIQESAGESGVCMDDLS